MIVVNRRDKLDWHVGRTVQSVLDEMGYDFVLLTVTVNGEHVPEDAYESHVVPDNADVRAIHLHHGG